MSTSLLGALGPFATSLTLLAAVLTSCSEAPTGTTIPLPTQQIIVDDSPAWSPQGDSIVYCRHIGSTDGPPGVYITSSTPGLPRLVAPFVHTGTLSHLSYSPDGMTLACKRGQDIGLLDVRSGQFTRLTHTDNGAIWPVWSPSGDSIAFARTARDAGEPADSSGIAFIDLPTGAVTRVANDAPASHGSQLQWSRDSGMLALIYAHSVYLLDPYNHQLRHIKGNGSGRLYEHPQWLPGGQRLLIEEFGIDSRTVEIWIVDAIHREWPTHLGKDSAISPDGRNVIVPMYDPTDPTGHRVILGIMHSRDRYYTTLRPVTVYNATSVNQ